jgi:hypothetical protein
MGLDLGDITRSTYPRDLVKRKVYVQTMITLQETHIVILLVKIRLMTLCLWPKRIMIIKSQEVMLMMNKLWLTWKEN